MTAFETFRAPFDGLAASDATYALLLGENVELEAGAADALVALAEKHADAGAVSGRLVGLDGRLVQAGGIAAADGSLWSYGAGHDPAAARYLHVREIDWATTDFLLVRLDALRAAEGLSDKLDGAARAADLGFRLRGAGFRVLFQPEAVATLLDAPLPAAPELDLTVVIPSHNRATLLRDSLESLVGQTLPHDRFEVIVVNDGSTDETPAVCAELAARLPLRHIEIENSGIAEAKNVGVRAALGRIVLFFDDDDLAAPDLLAEHVRVHGENPAEHVAVLGYTTWSPELDVTPLMKFVTDVGHYLFAYTSLSDGQRLDYTYFWGGRSSAKRDFMLRRGLFNRTFTFGSEDIELGYRLAKHGLEVVYARTAVSHMNRAVSFEEFCRRCERQGRSQTWFARMHDDPVVRDWCNVNDAESRYSTAAATLPHVIGEARKLLDKSSRELHANLWTTFDGLKLKGIVEAAGERQTLETASRHDETLDTARWATELAAQHPAEPRLMQVAASRVRGSRIFAADVMLPEYDRASGARRLFEMLRLLAEEGNAVTFVSALPGNERFANELRALGVEVHNGDRDRLVALGRADGEHAVPDLDLAELLTGTAPEIALVELWYVAEAYLPELRRHAPQARIVIDSVDVHFLREERHAELTGDGKIAAEAALTKRRELAVYADADALVTVTGADREVLERELPGKSVYVVPNIHDVTPGAPGPEGRDGILFVGNFLHRPNPDAAVWLHEEILPRVWAEVPDAHVTIVGYQPTPEVERLAGPNVTVAGHVPAMEPYLASSRVSVAPLRFGAGIKGKVCEALAAGLPVVATPVGTEGMGLPAGGGDVIAEAADAESFAAGIVSLLRDDARWSALQDGGRAYIEENLSSRTVARALVELVATEAALDAPKKTSIVMLVRDNLDLTRECLESIEAHTPEPHELVLVDNASGPITAAWLREYARTHAKVHLVVNQTNLGYALGNNLGAAIATGGVIVFQNNDTIVTEGWLGRLTAHLDDAGLAGPLTNRTSGPQLVDPVPYDGMEAMHEYAARVAVENAGVAEPTIRLVGFSMAVRRDVLSRIGGFDPRFGLGNLEDDDLFVRARAEGFHGVVARDVFVHHVGSATFKDSGIDQQEALVANWRVYKEKWQIPAETALGDDFEIDADALATVPRLVSLPRIHETHINVAGEHIWQEQPGLRVLQAFLPALAHGRTESVRASFDEVKSWADQHRRFEMRRRLTEVVLATETRGDAWTRIFAETAACLIDVLEDDPREPIFLNYAGVILYELAELGGAEALFKAARRLDPELEHVDDNLKAIKMLKGRGRSPLRGQLALDVRGLGVRARRVGAAAKPVEGRTVSLCMIVKDEEEMLPGCLEPIAPHVDEIVIVDTGSSDRTVEIAESFGAKVIHFPWNGSFADARNVSIENATGDWILYLDADEHMVAEDAPNLRALLGRTWREGFHLNEINYTGGDDSGTSVSHLALRLIQNRPGFRFEGRIHEQKTNLPTFLPERFETAPIRLLHYGYLKNRIADREKSKRNIELLEREAEEKPNAFNSFNLGSEYIALQDADRARKHLEDSWRMLGDGWKHIGYATILVARLATMRRATGDFDAARDAIRIGLDTFPDHTDLVLELAGCAFEQGDYAEAERLTQRCLEMGDAPAQYVATIGSGSYLALHLLGEIQRRRGDLVAAETTWKRSLAEFPTYTSAVLHLGSAMLERGAAVAEVEAVVPTDKPSAAMLLATTLGENGHAEDAERWFRIVLERQPGNSVARIGLVEALLSQRRYEDAGAEAALEAEDSPVAVLAHDSRLFAAAAGGDAAAVRTLAGDSGFYADWAAVLEGGTPSVGRMEDVPGALVALEALLRVQDFDAFERALTAFAAIELDPRERRELLARLYLRRGYLESAAEEWIAVAQDEPDAAAFVGLAQVAYAQGLPQDAVVLAEEALALDPAHEEATVLRERLLAVAA